MNGTKREGCVIKQGEWHHAVKVLEDFCKFFPKVYNAGERQRLRTRHSHQIVKMFYMN